jgi:ankyrin repeat protein
MEPLRSVKNTIEYACENGHLEVVKSLIMIPNIINNINLEQGFIIACQKGHLEIAQFLYNNLYPNLLFESKGQTDRVFSMIFRKINFNVFKWIDSLIDTNDSELDRYFELICYNESADNLDIINYVLEKWTNIKDYERGLNGTTYRGDLDATMLVLNKVKKQPVENWFRAAFTNGHLVLAEWLLETYPTIYSVNQIEKMFIDVCSGGMVEMTTLLFRINPNIEISYFNTAFFNACKNGHLEMAKWLISVEPNINISLRLKHTHCLHLGRFDVSDDCSFSIACKNGHLQIVQFLYSLKPTLNILMDNDYAFRMACKYNHIEVVKWFNALVPDKYKYKMSIEYFLDV